eukprot:171060-Chlamydomonas_euryale.AAC.1
MAAAAGTGGLMMTAAGTGPSPWTASYGREFSKCLNCLVLTLSVSTPPLVVATPPSAWPPPRTSFPHS